MIMGDVKLREESTKKKAKRIKRGDTYTASDIKVLKGLEGVRARPSMYIGSVDWRGLHHLVYEVIDNSIDEAVAGYCKNITVTLHTDGSCSVEDDGRGIPVDRVPGMNKSGVEVVLTTLHAGAKFHKKTYKVSGGLHGVGVSVVNALSEWLEVEVKRQGKIWYQRYERGVPLKPLKAKGKIPASETGSKVRFKPDTTIFKTVEFKFDIIAERLKELAYLNPGVRLTLIDERTGQRVEYLYERGLLDFLEDLLNGRTPAYEPIIISVERGTAQLDIAMVHVADREGELIYSYVNNINTIEGGTHVTGFKTALTRTVNKFFQQTKQTKDVSQLSGDDIRQGLIAIVNLKLVDPQFEGQTKAKLANPEVKSLVEAVVEHELGIHFYHHPEKVQAIISSALTNYKARIAAKRARELVKGRRKIERLSTMLGKLAECISKDVSKRELFIVEGDSAGGSAKLGRDKMYQAVLPLRGKIINVEKASIDKIIKNEEIKLIISALGANVNYGNNRVDTNKLRYSKIIIATDADVDGYHIRTLLLTFFYRYMRELIEEGYIYIAQPPLYRVRWKGKDHYLMSDKELEEFLKKHPSAYVQRFKGLGEMNPKQLWETTLNPKTRRLKLVTIEDAEFANEILETLMGSNVDKRRRFIQENASMLSLEELDY